jgi:hypothetical protein
LAGHSSFSSARQAQDVILSDNPNFWASVGALSHAIGSDSQRPFAIVIVGGLISDLVMSIFLLPTLYVWIAGAHDVLPASDSSHLDEA